MRCIWCKQNADDSKSVEHILPESLGNRDHTLPRGWVCDPCNNYLARKVEKPFLDSCYGRTIRFEKDIPNKRGRIPPIRGIHLQSMLPIEVQKINEVEDISIGSMKELDESKWILSIKKNQGGTLILPMSAEPPNDRALSRFIAKVGLEMLASKCIHVTGSNDELANQPELDEIRRYVRLGTPANIWPIHMRRIYPVDMRFADEEESFEVLNEWAILCTASQEYYAVIALFGAEYTINLGGPELDGYVTWLHNNNNRSPLYWDDESGKEPEANSTYFK